jgi:hypothetical protein
MHQAAHRVDEPLAFADFQYIPGATLRFPLVSHPPVCLLAPIVSTWLMWPVAYTWLMIMHTWHMIMSFIYSTHALVKRIVSRILPDFSSPSLPSWRV